MLFLVSSISPQGRKGIHFMESISYAELSKKLKRDKIITLDIRELPPYLAYLIPKRGKKISEPEVIEFLENLHLIIKSGIPLHQGIVDMANESENKRFKDMLFDIASEINNGKSLSGAIEPFRGIFSNMIINLVQIGEETGQLELTLHRGATFMKRTLELKKKAKSALIYPSFALFAVTGAMLVWMIYVLPQMTSLFAEMDVELPALTIFMMWLSDFLRNYILFVFIFMALFFTALKISHKKNQKVRFYTDKFFLRVPVIRDVISSFNIAFISEYMRLAIVSGIPIFNALDTIKKNINNEIFKKALSEATDKITQGSQLSSAFSKTGMFSTFMIRMMSIGESSGTLEGQLDIVSNHYYEKVDHFAQNIGKIIEPAVLIFVGGFMALVMAGLMGPMYDLVGSMN